LKEQELDKIQKTLAEKERRLDPNSEKQITTLVLVVGLVCFSE
jgi:hypothetical protein